MDGSTKQGVFDKCVTLTRLVMHPSSSNTSRSRQPRLDTVSSHAFPQAIVSPTFLQSPSSIPQAFPFPNPQYDHPPDPPNLLPPNWQRPRATSSYALESTTLAFPEPQLYRSTSTRAPSPPPRTSRHDLDRSRLPTPALPPRNPTTGPRTHSTEVLSRDSLSWSMSLTYCLM
jgi:hypothetical protein